MLSAELQMLRRVPGKTSFKVNVTSAVSYCLRYSKDQGVVGCKVGCSGLCLSYELEGQCGRMTLTSSTGLRRLEEAQEINPVISLPSPPSAAAQVRDRHRWYSTWEAAKDVLATSSTLPCSHLLMHPPCPPPLCINA